MADKDPKPDPNEEITLTRGELEDFLARRERDASMTDDEKQVRTMIREEVKAVFDGLFEIEPDDDGKRRQTPKGTERGQSLMDAFLGK